MKIRKSTLGIAVAVVLAGGLAWFAPPLREEIAQPASVQSPSGRPAETSRSAGVGALPGRGALGEARGDLFSARVPAPPVAARVEAPPAPVAPPNPYKVAGTLVGGDGKRVYLLNGDRVYEARLGDELEGGYRVEAIAADRVVLVYVPLGKKEELAIAATLGADVPLAPPTAAGPAVSGGSRAADASKPAELRWEGPATVRAGSPFSVTLRVSSFAALRATPMQLAYEPKLLEPLEVRAGKFFGAGKFAYRVNPSGSIFVGASGEGAAPGADAELVVVTFKPMRAGSTAEVRLTSLALQGEEGRALPHKQVGVFRTAIR